MTAVEVFNTEDSEFEDFAIERDERHCPGLISQARGFGNVVLRRREVRAKLPASLATRLGLRA